jgi:hypothetical protein
MSIRRNRSTPANRRKQAKIIPLHTASVVRLARVAEARRRIASGWYDRAEVRDSLVDAVLQQFRGR